MNKHTVAVYGSLRQGMGNHGLLSGYELIDTTMLAGARMVSLGGFPAIELIGDFDDKVVVEIYEVDDEGLARLDRLEGTDSTNLESDQNFYNRVHVLLDNGVTSYIYVMPECTDNYELVKSGDWVQYRQGVAA